MVKWEFRCRKPGSEYCPVLKVLLKDSLTHEIIFKLAYNYKVVSLYLVLYVCWVTQSCPTLCDPMNCSQSGSSVYGIFRQEYWSGLPLLSPGDLPNLGIQHASPTLVGRFFTTEPPGIQVYFSAAAAAAKSLQSCPTLCDPIDSSPPGSPIPGILQARTLEWVAISCSNAWKWKVKVKPLSRVWLLATPWTAAHQDPPSMGFSRQEYWSRGAIDFSSVHLSTLRPGIGYMLSSYFPRI